MMTKGYNFGGSTGLSYADLLRRRQNAIDLSDTSNMPMTLAGGLGAIGQAFIAKNARDKTTAAMSKRNGEFRNALMGEAFRRSMTTPSGAPVTPQGRATANQLVSDLGGTPAPSRADQLLALAADERFSEAQRNLAMQLYSQELGSGDAALRTRLLEAQVADAERGPATYEIVHRPYGLDGVGQRNTQTGQISGYQRPAAPTDNRTSFMKEFDAFNERRKAQGLPPATEAEYRKTVHEATSTPAARPTATDVNGRLRYKDDGSLVFADVSKDPEPAKDGDGFKNERDLRKEFTTGAKTYVDVRNSYQRVLSAVKDPSPAGDLALIFNYMKLLDPGSVVRESEFATAAASGSYPERLKAAAAKVAAGERLSDEMRADFSARAGELYKGQLAFYERHKQHYESLAAEYGFDPSRIVSDLTKGLSISTPDGPVSMSAGQTFETGDQIIEIMP